MPRTIDYFDRELVCACGSHIASVRLDAQCLILATGLILFSFAAWQCECGRNGRFISPPLFDEKPTIDNQIPDSKQIEQKAAKIAKQFKTEVGKNTRTARSRESYGIHQHKGGKFVVQVGGYIGSYETHDEAVKVRDVELAKQFGYKAKEQQTDTQPQNQFSAS
jgi:hypothetical protein